MGDGFVMWLTGLSGSGKSTLATMLSAELRAHRIRVEVLDGDEVQKDLFGELGFSKKDRDIKARRLGYVAKLLARSGACAIVAAIGPYRDVRDEQRAQIARFVEVYCRCDLATLTRRDPKGLYQKALAGEIREFTGVSAPYEPPENAEVVVDTATETPRESLRKIIDALVELGFIPGQGAAIAPSRSVVKRTALQLPLPHGGELVSRFLIGAEAATMARSAGAMPSVQVDERTLSDIEMIGVGALSPLTGFMNREDYLRVLCEMRLACGLPWSIPITLSTDAEHAETLGVGSRVALCAPDGQRVAVLDLSDKFVPDKELEAQSIYKTTDRNHPGVAYLMGTGAVYLGGDVHVLERPGLFPQFRHRRDPADTRALFADRNWLRVVGFQTRNPLHRGHEYITKCALEICDGLLIHAFIGGTDEEEIPNEVRMRCHELILARYYAKERVVLEPYPAARRYAGPREALLQAIVRKNYGCSHFIVGRDHAGVGSHYGAKDSQHVFDAFSPEELGIQLLYFDSVFYSTTLGSMATDKTAPDDDSTKLPLSGTRVREMLARGELPPPEIMRPELAEILLEAAKIRT